MTEQSVIAPTITDKLVASREASRHLVTATAQLKNAALEAIASAVLAGADRILAANELDVANGRDNGMTEGLQDRLRLTEARLQGLADADRKSVV